MGIHFTNISNKDSSDLLVNLLEKIAFVIDKKFQEPQSAIQTRKLLFSMKSSNNNLNKPHSMLLLKHKRNTRSRGKKTGKKLQKIRMQPIIKDQVLQVLKWEKRKKK